MKVKKVIRYETSDGQVFETESCAEEQQVLLDLTELVERCLGSRNIDSDDVAYFILNHKSEIESFWKRG